MSKWRNIIAVTMIVTLLICTALLIAAFLDTPLFDQARLPIFIAALSFVISAFGAVSSWIIVLEMQRDREALYKPDVFANIEFERGLVFFVLRNDGRSSAYNVIAKLDPPPIDRNGNRIDEAAWLQSPVKTLVPGAKMTKVIDAQTAVFKRDTPRQFRVQLSYESATGHKYNEPPYVLDIDQYKGMTVPTPTVEESLQAIAEALKAIGKDQRAG